MPTASDELRDMMKAWFDDPIDDGPPYKFLMEQGWRDSGGGLLIKPDRKLSNKEIYCAQFLRDEWDYAIGDPRP